MPGRTIVEGAAALAAEELDALDAADTDDSGVRAVDLQARLSLIAADVFGDAASASRWLELADRHPVAPWLMLAEALTEGSPERLEAAQSAIDSLAEDEATRAVMLAEMADAWLYRFGESARAAKVARLALALAPEAGLANELRQLLYLALANAGEWQELRAALVDDAAAAAGAPEEALALLVEAAHIAVDRFGDDAAAAEILARAERSADALPEQAEGKAAARVEAFGAALLSGEVAARTAGPGSAAPAVVTPLSRRLRLLVADPAAERDASAHALLLAQRIAAAGDTTRAADLLSDIAGRDRDQAWGARAAGLLRLELAAATSAWDEAAARARELGAAEGGGVFVAAYLRRAAEITTARLGDGVGGLALWREVYQLNRRNAAAARAVEQALIAGGDAAVLFEHLTGAAIVDPRRRAALLRRAAAVAESRLGDHGGRAAELRADALVAGDESGQADERVALAGRFELARLYRQGEQASQQAEIYRTIAGTIADGRVASALLCAAGALELAAGVPERAEATLSAAASRAPADVLARAALSALYRTQSRWKELADALTEIGALCADAGARVGAFRELGEVAAARLGDNARARAALEKLLEIEPDDVPGMRALAALCDGARDWDAAVALRERAIESVGDPAQAAALFMEIGEIEETRRKNENAALAAYERAVELDDASVAALRAAGRIYRRRKQYGELLGVLRAELSQTGDPTRLLAIQLEIARCSELVGEGAEAAIGSYQQALAIDPANEAALTGLERLARADGRWDVIAAAFAAAPRTAGNLKVLCEAYRNLKKWLEFAEARRQEIEEIAGGAADKARLARELAEVYEQEIGDVDAAIAAYELSLEHLPSDRTARQALARLLEQNERWLQLIAACERELASVPARNVDRQIALLLRLGELRRDHADSPAEAAIAYEAVLERKPDHPAALEALEALYAQLGREPDLVRIAETRAEMMAAPGDRAAAFARAAALKARRNDLRGAIDLYRKAFSADPSSREVFTGAEELCYKTESWDDVKWLYTSAIEAVEAGRSRTLRLSDLYLRLGQLELQYLNDKDASGRCYLRALELDPDDDSAVLYLESIYVQRGDWAGLIAMYDKRADLATDHRRRVESLQSAAQIASAKLEDPVEAARLYSRLLEIDPTDNEALAALERHHEGARDWERLVHVLSLRLQAMTEGDGATSLLKRIARICEEGLRDEERAIEYYQRILEITPGNGDALDALSRIHESTERWEDFIEITRRQIRVTTDRNMKALLYFKCGSVMEAKFNKEDDAIRYYDAAIKTSPSCLPAVHGLRDLYRRRQDWPRVIQTLELEVKLWQDDKERAGVFAQIGRIYAEHLDQRDRALHYYESALAVDPECLPANRALFDQYFALGDWERARPLAQALAQKAMREGDPHERSEFYRRYGIVARMTGDPRAAAESLVIALEIMPGNQAALDEIGDLVKTDPGAYDFPATYRELEKIYRKRDDTHALLARVMMAQATMKEREGDLQAAEEMYEEAVAKAKDDLAVVSALVDLNVDMRRFGRAVEVLARFLDESSPPADVRIAALRRQAEIHSDGEMDAGKAVGVLREIIRLDDGNEGAHYLLAQEMFRLGRFPEARAEVERAIEVSAAPGKEVVPETLARYYYYLGRIIEAAGEQRGAAAQYRRAAEYDPSYSPPALALARRSFENGDQSAAESLLINAAHEAMQKGGAGLAVPLQRGLARILLSSGDRMAAVEAYRGILAVEPDEAADRVALAEIYAVEDVTKAIHEARKVLEHNLRYAPAYRLLASLYSRTNETERAARVLAVMELLSFAEGSDRGAAAKLFAVQPRVPLRGVISGELRKQLLICEGAAGPMSEIFDAVGRELSSLFPRSHLGDDLAPLSSGDDPTFAASVADVGRLVGIDAEVYLGSKVPGAVIAVAFPRPFVVVDRDVLGEGDAARRFALGWAFELIRGGCALLAWLGERHLRDLVSLLRSLTVAPGDRPAPTEEFLASVSRPAASVINRYAGSTAIDVDAWIDGMIATARRTGLLACDDLAAATRMIARLGGEVLDVGQESTLGLGLVIGGEDLVSYYLSDSYHRLRQALNRPVTASSG